MIRRRGLNSVLGLAAVGVVVASYWLWQKQPDSVARLSTEPRRITLLEEAWIDATIVTKQQINAVELYIEYDANALEVLEIDKKESLVKLWILDSPKQIESGKIWLAGGVPSPGFTGEGSVAKLRVKPKRAGEMTVKLTDSRLLRHDGLGTSLPLALEPTQLRVEP